MKTYGAVMAGLCLLFLGLFGVAMALEIPWLVDPGPWLGRSGWWAALGAALLVLDVVLPVPASLLMIAHGALFGAVWGTAVSLVGATAAAAFGFALGRWASAPLERFMSEAERREANELLRRFGDLAVVASRPVPILAESVAVLAGTADFGWRRFLGASLLGNLPACALYAVTGATARDLGDTVYVFGLTLGVAAAVWWAGLRLRRQPAPRALSGEDIERA